MELQWPLILFTTFVAWSAGLFASQAIYALRGEGAKSQMAAWVTAAVLLVVGGVAVFLHLEHWERIFNGFGHISSGITQELIAIVVLAVVAVAYLVCLRRAEARGDAAMPAWICWAAIVVSVALVVVMAHSYMMAARPAWNTVLQLFSLIGAACVLGPATMMLVCGVRGERVSFGSTLLVAGAIVNAVCVVAYAVYLQTIEGAFAPVEFFFDSTSPNAGLVDVAGMVAAHALVLWIGAVAVGAVAPLACAYAAKRVEATRKRTCLSAGAVCCAVAGAICLRMVFYSLGASAFLIF